MKQTDCLHNKTDEQQNTISNQKSHKLKIIIAFIIYENLKYTHPPKIWKSFYFS